MKLLSRVERYQDSVQVSGVEFDLNQPLYYYRWFERLSARRSEFDRAHERRRLYFDEIVAVRFVEIKLEANMVIRLKSEWSDSMELQRINAEVKASKQVKHNWIVLGGDFRNARSQQIQIQKCQFKRQEVRIPIAKLLHNMRPKEYQANHSLLMESGTFGPPSFANGSVVASLSSGPFTSGDSASALRKDKSQSGWTSLIRRTNSSPVESLIHSLIGAKQGKSTKASKSRPSPLFSDSISLFCCSIRPRSSIASSVFLSS